MREPLRKLGISYEELRSLVLEYLAGAQDDPTLQFNSLKYGVAEHAVRRGLSGEQAAVGRYRDYLLSDEDYTLCCDIIWDFITEGIVRPGPGKGGSQDLPFFHVTDRGREVLKHGSSSPYDPDGYLKRLSSEVPSLDPVILAYLIESLHTFRIGCILSSTITLGCASERAILNLIDAYANALPQAKGEVFRKKTEGKMIKMQFDELLRMIGGHLKGKLPREIRENLDLDLVAVFAMFRVHRNEAGHPTGNVLSRGQAYANLQIFPHYVRHLYSLIDWLSANSHLL